MKTWRSRSRSPISDRRIIASPEFRNEKKEKLTNSKMNLPTIFVGNFPESFNFNRIRNFIKDVAHSPAVKNSVGFINPVEQGYLVEFCDYETCKKAVNELQGTMINGRPVYAALRLVPYKYNQWLREQGSGNMGGRGPSGPPPHQGNPNTFSSRPPHIHPNRGPSQQMQPDFLEPDSNAPQFDTYGLNRGFLQDLGIQLPLNNQVFVLGLDESVTESLLREVFGLAGIVMNIFLKVKKKDGNSVGHARIEFDHPLEAVQAISMFNQQELCNRIIHVKMNELPEKPLIPGAIKSVGPGLGPGGRPMRDIRTSVELEQFKRQIKEEIQSLRNEIINIQKSQNNMGLQNQNLLNQSVSQVVPALNTFGANMVQGVQGQMGTDLVTLLATLQNQIAQNNVVQTAMVPSAAIGSNQFVQNTMAPNQMMPNGGIQNAVNMAPNVSQNEWRSQGQNQSFGSDNGYYGSQQNINNSHSMEQEIRPVDSGAKPKTSDMLMFINLPGTVTPAALANKMREVGELRTAEHIGEGKAIVRFVSPSDAERCLKLFDRSKVDGQVIEVKPI